MIALWVQSLYTQYLLENRDFKQDGVFIYSGSYYSIEFLGDGRVIERDRDPLQKSIAEVIHENGGSIIYVVWWNSGVKQLEMRKKPEGIWNEIYRHKECCF